MQCSMMNSIEKALHIETSSIKSHSVIQELFVFFERSDYFFIKHFPFNKSIMTDIEYFFVQSQKLTLNLNPFSHNFNIPIRTLECESIPFCPTLRVAYAFNNNNLLVFVTLSNSIWYLRASSSKPQKRNENLFYSFLRWELMAPPTQ